MSTEAVFDCAVGLPIGPKVDATPARRPGGLSLVGRIVALAPFDIDRHAAELFAATHGPERERLWFYLGDGPFSDRAAFDANLARWTEHEERVFYAILDRASGRVVGHIAYMHIVPADHTVEIGNVLFSPSLARTTGATEAVVLMLRHAFDDLGYDRVEWKCNTLNAPSLKAALRLGFVYEGVFRRHMIQKGRSRDTAWLAMVVDDWPARKAAFDAWLSPANFYEDGAQRQNLAQFIATSGAP